MIHGGHIVAATLGVACIVAGCAVPVEVRPRETESGKPIPIPVAQTQPPPEQPRSDFADVGAAPAPGFDWNLLITALLGVGTVAGGGWAMVASRGAGVLRAAVQAAAMHADRMEHAESLEEVAKMKALSAQEQERAGVRKIIQRARGKE
jgi:hypothetical protein